MRLTAKVYDGLVTAMAMLAGAMLLAMMVVIFLDVVLRNLGSQSSAHFFTFTEYALLIVPCLGAPWLVRERGHVYVEILFMYLSPGGRRALTVLIGIVSILVCLVLAWAGFQVTLKNFLLADKDVRSLDMPRWMIAGFIPLSFLMMAIEFLRFLWKGESPLAGLSGETEAPEKAG